MRPVSVVALLITGFTLSTLAQEISPYLFGQNHWIATGDEGNRVGYLHLLWPRVQESGVKTVLSHSLTTP